MKKQVIKIIKKLIKARKDQEWFKQDKAKWVTQSIGKTEFPFKLRKILNEKNEDAGTIKGAYFHQDLLVAQLIFKNNPKKHVDIGSRTDGFVAHVAAFREIELFDVRPLHCDILNIKFKQADMTVLDSDLINYTDSISSLHAIEHFGLGRYGDKIDYKGHLKAVANIYKILQKGGTFYFSVPIGPQRVEFNAQRVFNLMYLYDVFKDKFKIKSFHFIDDNGNLFKNIPFDVNNKDLVNNFGCNCGTSIFELIK
jgi:SAM-dependent methyltransferase